MSLMIARNNDFPTSLGGKGHDTAVVAVWLQSVLRGLVAWLSHPSTCTAWVQENTCPGNYKSCPVCHMPRNQIVQSSS